MSQIHLQVLHLAMKSNTEQNKGPEIDIILPKQREKKGQSLKQMSFVGSQSQNEDPNVPNLISFNFNLERKSNQYNKDRVFQK